MHLSAMLALMAGIAPPASAGREGVPGIDVPDGALSRSVPVLARQAGISISVSNETLWRTQVRGVRGNLPPGEALARMLAGTPGRAVQVSETSWRIEPAPARAAGAAAKVRPQIRQAPATEEGDAPEPILVTAGKLDQPRADHPGTMHLLKGRDLAFGGERGTDSILSRLSSLSSTHLGSGRNKLFIRGMADSSFTGPTQATVGQYLGDIRLSYNSPDPDLRLQDIDRVEVLEGSQGTLYGAGSLAGIFRLVPNRPDPTTFGLKANAGFSLTQHGQPGADFAATTNLPMGGGHALRMTGYALSEGGYIDNPLRGTMDINRARIGGGRASLLLDAGNRWTVELGGLYQFTQIADAQYASREGPPLSRSSPVVEDSDAGYSLLNVVVRKEWGGLVFQSSTARIRQSVDERYNASKTEGAALLFEQRNGTRLLVNETRLWRPVRDGVGWVLGVSALNNETVQKRAFDTGTAKIAMTGASNGIREFTGYGKVSVQPAEWVILSGGARLTHSRLRGRAEDVSPLVALAGAATTAERTAHEWLPSAEALVHASGRLAIYFRYEESFRPGGLAIEGDFVRRFRSDSAASSEAGLRWASPRQTLLASVSAALADWKDIQADFMDGNGFPTTANIGNGRIMSLSGALAWQPAPDLRLDLGAVFNDSRVVALSPEAARFTALAAVHTQVAHEPSAVGGPMQPGGYSGFGRIPNVADFGLNGAVDYRTEAAGLDLRMTGWLKYVGSSRLGIGPTLGDRQGNYLDTGFAARLGAPHRGVTLTLTNLFDSKGNRFALGTPFETTSGRYMTPQRPRTVRLAVDHQL